MSTETVKAQSIDEFCRAYGISRGTFYNLERAGKAPKTLKLGARRVVPVAAIEAWERSQLGEAA